MAKASTKRVAIQRTGNSIVIFLILGLVTFVGASGLISHNLASAQSVGTWQNTTSYPFTVDSNSCPVYSGYVFCVGGFNSSSYADTNAAYYSSLSSSGVGSWTSTTSYPKAVESQSCVIYSAYIYCVGGYYSNSNDTDLVYYAPISTTSGIGTWKKTTSYPTIIESGSCVAASGYIYCVTGLANGNYSTSVYYAALSSTGVGTWTSTTSYPVAVLDNSCAAYSGYLYCVGGTQSSGTDTDAVYYASISSTGVGTWYSTSSYPTTIDSQSCTVYSGYIYCVGGWASNSALTSSVYYSAISGSGAGSWTNTTSYPTVIESQPCVTSSGYIYCIGGSALINDTDLVGYAEILPPQTTTTPTTTTTVTETATLTQTATTTATSTLTFSTTTTATTSVPTTTTVSTTLTVSSTTTKTVSQPTTSTTTILSTITSHTTQTSYSTVTSTATISNTSTVTLSSGSTSTQTVTSISTTTVPTTTTQTNTSTITVTSFSESTSTLTTISTQTSTITSTTTQLIPTKNTVKCVPSSVKVNNTTTCTSTVKSADGGKLQGTDTFSSEGSGTFGNVSCESKTFGLLCTVPFTPREVGAYVIIANYSGDTYHQGSVGDFKLHVTKAEPTSTQGVSMFGIFAIRKPNIDGIVLVGDFAYSTYLWFLAAFACALSYLLYQRTQSRKISLRRPELDH